jgi:hypothetical protein
MKLRLAADAGDIEAQVYVNDIANLADNISKVGLPLHFPMKPQTSTTR